jgi:hypothetical protein
MSHRAFTYHRNVGGLGIVEFDRHSSIGSETNTGPIGGVVGRWMARANTAGASLAMAGSAAHFTNGRGTVVGSML